MSERKQFVVDGGELKKWIHRYAGHEIDWEDGSFNISALDFHAALERATISIQPPARIEAAIRVLEEHLKEKNLTQEDQALSAAELRTLRWVLKDKFGYTDENFGLKPETPNQKGG